MKFIVVCFCLFVQGSICFAAQFEGSVSEWKKDKVVFNKSEESFKKALEVLKSKYIDKNITEADLYRAATEGMLAALNSDKENWNAILTPNEIEEMQIEMSGKLVGIGVVLEFDKVSGNARVRGVLPGSSALKAGLKKGDQILSVNGKRYKELSKMAQDIRGKSGESLTLRVLREDQVNEMKIVRHSIGIPMFTTARLNDQTAYLEISGFTNNAEAEVSKKLASLNDPKITKLIIDLRGNSGGSFEQAIGVIGLFLNKGELIAKTKTREGGVEEYRAKVNAWNPNAKLVILTSAETRCAAELMAASLKENRHATLMGMKTLGKWTVESVESLPNNFSMKYSVMLMESPSGQSYTKGLSPDIEIAKSEIEEGADWGAQTDIKARSQKDSAIKAALELN